MSIGIGTALAGAGAISGLTSLFGGIEGSDAASSAAKTQAAAEGLATQLQGNIFNTIQGNLAPYRAAGTDALGNILRLTGIGAGDPLGPSAPLTSPISTAFPYSGFDPGLPGISVPNPQISVPNPSTSIPGPFQPQGGLSETFSPTLADLKNFPGYQFALDQGELAVQGAYSGTQPGGATIKAAANYAEGLAGSTEQQAYQQWLGQIQQQLGQYSASGGLNIAGQGLGLTATDLNLKGQGLGLQGTALNLQGQGLGLQKGQLTFSDLFGQQQQGFTQALAGANLTLQQKLQIYNMLTGVSSGGLGATGQGTTAGTSLGQSAAQTIGAQGAASAAGTVGSANALISGVSGIGSSINNTALLLALGNAGLFGKGGLGAPVGGTG